ncbi:uncharacterized protein LY89DRAFT_410902 [Mollisia scopiformis]|uniref:Nuclear pore protein n=1 Tax=Mollisia scopiformis TaxID=149040 RepID=A0A132B3W7_MOLSC|nr:uncharacterized protein LY89DRAFT_410902 [Mollisia scopiformis]KUJ06367.1 hypothetical protein LY89DRAFT_410902 [Mollisia scopiformis]
MATNEGPSDSNAFSDLFNFENGDVTIQVNYYTKQITGKVVSIAMAMASTVWKKFIFPPWTQDQLTSTGNGERDLPRPAMTVLPVDKLDFREDDGDALLILLRIAHLQFKHVPSVVTLDFLYNIAILCNLYDCVELVKPWLSLWLEVAHRRESPKRLIIAWTFGKHEMFQEASEALTWNLRVSRDGRTFVGGEDLDGIVFPPGILESMLKVRETAIQSIFDVYLKWIGNYTCSPHRRCSLEMNHCDPIMLGNLIRKLVELDLWPTPSPADWTGTPRGLVYVAKLSFEIPHKNCLDAFEKDFESRTARETLIGDIVSEAELLHMEGQAKRLQ